MALTNLTSLTAAQYRALQISGFSKAPSRTSSGNPDSRISIQLGGWVGTSIMAFTISNQANISSGLTVNSNTATNTINADVVPGSNPASLVTYWTVDMGANASNSNWSLSYQVDDGDTDTGTWVFTKGSGGDDQIRY